MILERLLPKGLTIGQGYDLAFGDAYGIAVHTGGFHREEYDEAIAEKLYIPQTKLKPRGLQGVSDKEGQEIEYNLLQIDSSESLSQALDISVSASFGYPGILSAVDVSAATRFSGSQKINQFSTYVLVSVIVKNPPLLIENPALTPKAAEIWDGGNGRSQFYQNFGSSYLLGYVPGGILYGLIEISTENIAQKRYLKNLLNGSISTFKGRGELSNQFRQELEAAGREKQLKVSILQLGGSGDTIDDDVKSLLEQAKTFPALIRDRPVYSFGIFADYQTLLTEAVPPDSSAAEQSATIAALGKKYLRYRDYLGDLEYVIDESHFYRFPEHLGLPKTQLRTLRETYDREKQRVVGEMDVLELRAKRCRDVKNLDELLKLLPVKTGERVPQDLWLYLEDRSHFEIEKKVELPREDMVELNGMTRMVAGSIGSDGEAIAGREFRSSKTGKGRYHIEFDRPFRHPPTIIVSVDGDAESRIRPEAQADNLVATYKKNEREFYVKTISAHRVEDEEETGFSFIAIEFMI